MGSGSSRGNRRDWRVHLNANVDYERRDGRRVNIFHCGRHLLYTNMTEGEMDDMAHDEVEHVQRQLRLAVEMYERQHALQGSGGTFHITNPIVALDFIFF